MSKSKKMYSSTQIVTCLHCKSCLLTLPVICVDAPGGVWDAQQLLRAFLTLAWVGGWVGFMGRICVWNVNISQVAEAGGHHINNMLLHCWHPTQGYIPAVMGSSWTGVSGRTVERWRTQRDTPTSLLTHPSFAAIAVKLHFVSYP